MTRDAEDAAIHALREATSALAAGDAAVADATPGPDGEPDVAVEVALLLEAAAHLVRRTDLDAVPRNGTNHRLHAVVQGAREEVDVGRGPGHRGGAGGRSDVQHLARDPRARFGRPRWGLRHSSERDAPMRRGAPHSFE